jgi:hypothetical protein
MEEEKENIFEISRIFLFYLLHKRDYHLPDMTIATKKIRWELSSITKTLLAREMAKILFLLL